MTLHVQARYSSWSAYPTPHAAGDDTPAPGLLQLLPLASPPAATWPKP